VYDTLMSCTDREAYAALFPPSISFTPCQMNPGESFVPSDEQPEVIEHAWTSGNRKVPGSILPIVLLTGADSHRP
jgi:hypothetical protein